jgi:hypothetical protein
MRLSQPPALSVVVSMVTPASRRALRFGIAINVDDAIFGLGGAEAKVPLCEGYRHQAPRHDRMVARNEVSIWRTRAHWQQNYRRRTADDSPCETQVFGALEIRLRT